MKKRNIILGLFFAIAILACEQNNDTLKPTVAKTTEFNKGIDGWSHGITDYLPVQEDIIEFVAKTEKLPVDNNDLSYMLSSSNRSDDLFMYIYKKQTGFLPNTSYLVSFEVELASQYPESSIGIGGSPGGSVYLKAAVNNFEPEKIKHQDGSYRLNWDTGSQSASGANSAVLGTIGISGEEFKYQIIKKDNLTKPIQVKTNEKGEVWLVVGTDSGFEGKTTLYYTKIKANFKQV